MAKPLVIGANNLPAELASGDLALPANPTTPLGAVPKQYVDAIIPPGYIDGLKMVWVSGTALTVTSGSAYIPNTGTVLSAPSPIAKTGLSLTASTWYHVYLYSNSGIPSVEVVTTAPDTPYNGTARAKTGDASRRYVGSVKTDGSGGIFKFLHTAPATISYNVNINQAPFFVLSAGSATTSTSISCSGCVPVTSRLVKLIVLNSATNTSYCVISNSDGPTPPTEYIAFASPNGVSAIDGVLNSSQAYTYAYDVSPIPSGSFQRVYGYTYER